MLPVCLCGAGHPLRPSSGPKAPKSGSRRPPRARGARPREGGTPPCSLRRCASGAGRGEGPSGPGAARPDLPGVRVRACGRRPWLRRGRWPVDALMADPPWAHGLRLLPEDVHALIGHRTSFQRLRQQVPRKHRGMREPCQGDGPAGGCAREQQGADGRTPPPCPRAGSPVAPVPGRLSPGGAGQTRPSGKSTGTVSLVHRETSFNPGCSPVMLKT